jgi:hypothetical protein
LSKKETPLTRWYWNQVGGLLIEEFLAVKQSPARGYRRLDGLIVLGEANSVSGPIEFDLTDRDVVVVQTKAERLGMYLMGQTLFSRDLVMSLGAKSVRSVALCLRDDEVLRPLLEKHEGCEVVVFDGNPDELRPDGS